MTSEALSAEEITALSAAFPQQQQVILILKAAGLETARQPWQASTPVEFWMEISRLLEAGVLVDGRRRILTEAGKIYPENSAFISPPDRRDTTLGRGRRNRRARLLFALGGGAGMLVLILILVPMVGSQPTTPDPVAVDSVTFSMDGSDTFVIPGPVRFTSVDAVEVEKTRGTQGHFDWFLNKGAALDGRAATIRMVLRGTADDKAVITGMEVVRNCREPATGTLFYSPPAGSDPSIRLGFDLDSQSSTAQILDDHDNFVGNYFNSYTISLRAGENQAVTIFPRTLRQYCEFTIQLKIATAGQSTTKAIDNNGQPFRITALTNYDEDFSAYDAVYTGGVANSTGSTLFRPADPHVFGRSTG